MVKSDFPRVWFARVTTIPNLKNYYVKVYKAKVGLGKIHNIYSKISCSVKP